MYMGRRQFLGASASAVIAAGMTARGRVFGANDRIRVGIMGMRSRGEFHMNLLAGEEQADVVAICDVDSRVLDERAGQFKTKTGKALKTYRDMREMLADDAVDVVFVAAPNHWHTLAAIWACQAGKDVYVEKPVTQTIWEGRQLIAAAGKHGRIIQGGTQRRSDPKWKRMVERIKAGEIGDVYLARIVVFNPRGPIGAKPDAPAPDWLDWTLWQGPAPERPFSENYVHYNWHWFWHYGSGEFGNNGVHYADITAWALDKGLPVHIHSSGGRFGYKDSAETPNTQTSAMTYADGTMFECEIRGLYTNSEGGARMGNMFYGSDGYVVDGVFFDKNGKEIPDANPPESVKDPVPLHVRSFFNAVRTRNHADIPANAEHGHIAAAHCHLGNISYRLGRSLEFDPVKEVFPNDEQANAMLTRPYREGFEVPEIT